LILADVNVLLYAFRADAPLHGVYRRWLQSLVNGEEPYAVSPQVLSSVIRIATNPKAFVRPESLRSVVAFATAVLDQPNCRIVQPGPRHWTIFCDICQKGNATGNLVQGAWFAALAMEHGCEWITEDRDYARFPGLRWRTIGSLQDN
jgi:toxin-antitoxin system PIN domain toxin